jgi:hypothetical protein
MGFIDNPISSGPTIPSELIAGLVRLYALDSLPGSLMMDNLDPQYGDVSLQAAGVMSFYANAHADGNGPYNVGIQLSTGEDQNNGIIYMSAPDGLNLNGAQGTSGTYTTVDGKTVTVTGGLITDIT